MKTVWILNLFAAAAFSQPVSFGVKGGVPLDRIGQDDTLTTVDKPRWIVGPTVEFELTGHFSVGFDALYRRFSYSTVRQVGSATFFENSTTSHWEFPVYVKYHFGDGGVRPFILGGAASEYARVSGTAGCTGDPLLCGSTGVTTSELKSSSWGGGYLVGGGVEFHWGILKIAPEFRYTHWVRGYFSGAGTDQPAVLIGLRF